MPGLLFGQGQLNAPPPLDPQQESSTASGGWRRADQSPANPPQEMPQVSAASADAASQPNGPAAPAYAPMGPLDQYGTPIRHESPTSGARPAQAAIPPQLTIKPGTFVTVRVDQPLSSDRNQQGDTFTATLVQPLVVDGVVAAARGETLTGRVVEAEKAGRVKGVSRLAVQLTGLSAVDGQQLPIQTQLISRSGPTSEGRDAGAIAGTTGLGAAIGAAADWGSGAAIGAGIGAVAGTIGVLLTRGHETVIYPESVLTFRIEAPVTISTERAPQAFRYVQPGDYAQPAELRPRPMPVRGMCGPYGCPPPYFYGALAYPYYYGPGFGLYYGPGFFFGRGYYRGFRR